MSRSIYFVRHGESTDNRDGLVGGAESDSALTELGISQAKETARSLGGIAFDLAIASPLTRAQHTAQLILDELGIELPIETRSEFIEKYVGDFAGKPYADYKAFKLSGGMSGETEVDMRHRVLDGLVWLHGQDFTNALVVSHSATIANVKVIAEDIPLETLASVPRLGNAEFYKVAIDEIDLK